jgi:ribosomal protein S18 acetylase RimI-like enzyme
MNLTTPIAPVKMPSMRPLSTLDYRDVKALFEDIFDKDEFVHFQTSWRRRDSERSIGLFIEESLVGFTLVKDTKLCYIGIDPDCQSEGFGSKLLQTIIAISKNRRTNLCLVPVNNTKVIHWYMRNGFRISKIAHSTEDGVPLITMNMNPYELRSR